MLRGSPAFLEAHSVCYNRGMPYLLMLLFAAVGCVTPYGESPEDIAAWIDSTEVSLEKHSRECAKAQSQLPAANAEQKAECKSAHAKNDACEKRGCKSYERAQVKKDIKFSCDESLMQQIIRSKISYNCRMKRLDEDMLLELKSHGN